MMMMMMMMMMNHDDDMSHVPKVSYSLGPTNPVIFSDDDYGVQSSPKHIVFRFHQTILRRSLDP